MTPTQKTNLFRESLKNIGDLILDLKNKDSRVNVLDGTGDTGEAIANVMLAYRHVEDARMRLGKVIQACEGGVSIYDSTGIENDEIPGIQKAKPESYISRLDQEISDLQGRMERLESFMDSNEFTELDEADQRLMQMQFETMTEYRDILENREMRIKARQKEING